MSDDGATATREGAPVGRDVRPEPGVRRSLTSRVLGRAKLVRLFGSPLTATFVKDTDYAVTVYTTTHGRPTVGKYFARSELGRAGFAAERLADDLFGDRPWHMPVVRWHRRGFTVPRLRDEDRLDLAVRTMSRDERLDASVWALTVLLEIYRAGYLHGDLQPHNVWLLDGRLVATDFETFSPRTPGVPFLDSGDVTGNDPAPRPRPLDPAFDPEDDWSFHHVVGVSLGEAVEALRARLLADDGDEARRLLDALDGRTT
ncbi:hypothetical protein [Cellulosimicrobium cellulans]|uniref:hypothetical protein n=1 Tax=Cellulosimicrobium cellulans TaxID=1710 RepID=UPI0024072D18|nr:hypothetical protein [Cellulosimicrobium cellulans]MDF9877539.1 hypothetical protein [Cellulosimicrobium cellulans]